MKRATIAALLLALMLASSLGLLWAQQDASSAQTSPDRINQRDRNHSEAMADEQKENASDRQPAQPIRRALVKDKSLSTSAHNMKVIAQNGTVTLKGSVSKQAIEAKAEK
jgi:hyperosmotically inducible protein